MTIDIQEKYEVYDDGRETSQNTKRDSEQEIGCGTGNCTEGSSVDIVLENYTINVFFDGTGNNAHNTEFRLLDEEYSNLYKQYREKLKIPVRGISNTPLTLEEIQEILKHIELKDERDQEIQDLKEEMDRYLAEKEYANRNYLKNNVSYKNEFSNVALLHLASEDQSKSYENIYIEGAGTTKDILDDQDGLGFAKGKSGVHSRVNHAFNRISLIIGKVSAHTYKINVFGFSRGAFYARVFCAWLKEKSFFPENSQWGRELAETRNKEGESKTETTNLRFYYLKEPEDLFSIDLLGIYDTVSSHGWGHYNDPATFPLAVTPEEQEIGKIIHLTAQNEYREHFPLTPITTALSTKSDKGKALELSFPGAHSNIGGAYTDIWKEEDHYISLKKPPTTLTRPIAREQDGAIPWNWWVEKGYYSISDFKEKGVLSKYYLAKRGVRNHYQYIMFRAMKKSAEEFATIIFNNEQERISERKTIFDKAKSGEDVKADEAKKLQKEITPKRAEILNNMDEAVQEFLQRHLHKHGEYVFNLSSVFNNEQDRKELYATYICNSLNPIWRLSNINVSGKEVIEKIDNSSLAKDEYDIQPEKEVVIKHGINPGVTGVENEGSSSRNRHWWTKEVKRPTVKGG